MFSSVVLPDKWSHALHKGREPSTDRWPLYLYVYLEFPFTSLASIPCYVITCAAVTEPEATFPQLCNVNMTQRRELASSASHSCESFWMTLLPLCGFHPGSFRECWHQRCIIGSDSVINVNVFALHFYLSLSLSLHKYTHIYVWMQPTRHVKEDII